MARRDGQALEGTRAEAAVNGHAYWRRVIGEQKKSGLSQDAFCQARGIPERRFRHWKYARLRGLDRQAKTQASEPPPAPKVTMVPVRVVQGTRSLDPGSGNGQPLAASAASSGVEVLLPGGLRISLQRGFDGAVLRSAVEVLGC